MPRPDGRRPHRQAGARGARADPARASRGARDRLRHGQRRERRRRDGPDTIAGGVDPGRRRRRHHERQPHLGQARDLPVPRDRTSGSCGRSTTARTACRVAAGGLPRRLDGTDVAVINLQGRTYMQPIDNPFTEADRLLDEGGRRRSRRSASSTSTARSPARRTRWGSTSTGGSARSSGPTPTSSPATSGSCRSGTAYQSDLGMTGPLHSVIGFDPKTVLPRFVNALPTRFEVGDGPVDPQRDPDRHRPGDRAGPRDRADPAAGRGLMPGAAPARTTTPTTRVVPPGPSTIDLHCPHAPLGRPPRAGRRSWPRRPRPASGFSRSPTTTTSSAYRELTAPGARFARPD